MPCKESWELFRSCFNEDEHVVIVTNFDSFEWGTLRITDRGCWLARSGVTDCFLRWEDIRFMAHDGFPVERLMGEDGERLIEEIHPTDSQQAIWDALLLNPRP